MPRAPLEPERIASSFSRAAKDYERHARVQFASAQRLAGMLAEQDGDFGAGRLLDLGCGTGLLLAHLLEHAPGLHALGLDIAEGMTDFCRGRWRENPALQFATGDIQHWRGDLHRPGFAWAASNCMFQWVDDLPAAFANVRAAMQPRGRLAIAVLVEGSLHELEASYAAAEARPASGIEWRGPEEYETALAAAGFFVSRSSLETCVLHYPDAFALLKSLRGIGAHVGSISGAPSLSPAALRRLAACYAAQFGDAPGVMATYRILYWMGQLS